MRIISSAQRLKAKNILSLFAILSVADCGQAVAGTLENADAAFKAGDCATALALWQPLASAGNAQAETGLGKVFENGCPDQKSALFWYRKAADQGDAEAEYRLGRYYVEGGLGVQPDLPKGLALLQKSAAQGNVHSLNVLGDFCREGSHDVPKDETQAFQWYMKAARLGDDAAEGRVVTALLYGMGVPKDVVQAQAWEKKKLAALQERAGKGDPLAQMSLGMEYEFGFTHMFFGFGIARDLTAALHWYQEAASHDGRLQAMAKIDVSRVKGAIAAQRNSKSAPASNSPLEK